MQLPAKCCIIINNALDIQTALPCLVFLKRYGRNGEFNVTARSPAAKYETLSFIIIVVMKTKVNQAILALSVQSDEVLCAASY